MESEKKVDWMARLHGAASLCALVFAGLLIGSGIGLAMAYVPSQSEAFASVLYLRQQGGLGALLRSLHYHLSSGAQSKSANEIALAMLSQFPERRPPRWLPRASGLFQSAVDQMALLPSSWPCHWYFVSNEGPW